MVHFFRIVFALGLLLSISASSYSQDLRLFSIVSPTSGCNLSNAETVSVLVINVGPDIISGNFDVTYLINGAGTVTENVMLPPVFNNGSLITYTFSATADLSTPGSFDFTSYIDLAGDVNQANDTVKNYFVVSDPLTVGGTTSGTTTVCESSNNGIITLSSFIGSILSWESSPDNSTWTSISNTSNPFTYSNLSASTYFRALVKSGTCASQYSTSTLITVDMASVGGDITGSTSVCPVNSGTLTLQNYFGNVTGWESSTDNGSTWSLIANTTNQLSYSNVAVTTIYRARVQNGVCNEILSGTATITILPPSSAGVLTGDATVCAPANNGSLTLSGEVGSIVRWESSIDGGANWISIANTTNQLTYNNLTTTTKFRVVVQSCAPAAFSNEVTVTVDSPSIAGTLNGSATVCGSGNSGLLDLTGFQGSTFVWENSADGVTWSSFSNSLSDFTFNNLTATTHYRVLVKNGVCDFDTSSIATITVDQPSDGGSVAGSTTVCVLANSGQVDLSGYIGQILRWEASADNGNSWNIIGNTNPSLNYNNIPQTIIFRAIVKNGVCPESPSTGATITVDNLSVAGIISSADSSFCEGEATGIISLSGFTGTSFEWNSSSDLGSTWSVTGSTTNSEAFNSLANETWFRAIVKNGSCSGDTTDILKIQILTASANAGRDTSITAGSSVILNGSGGVSYEWSPSTNLSSSIIPNPVASPILNTTYTLTATNQNGCKATDEVIITVSGEFTIIVPNFISPNGDGINDEWFIEKIENFNTKVSIFNIDGKEIFTASPYLNNWDGKWSSYELPEGTYYYILQIPEQEQVIKGNITLVRK